MALENLTGLRALRSKQKDYLAVERKATDSGTLHLVFPGIRRLSNGQFELGAEDTADTFEEVQSTVGDFIYHSKKQGGVETGYNAVKGWKDKDTQKLLQRAFQEGGPPFKLVTNPEANVKPNKHRLIALNFLARQIPMKEGHGNGEQETVNDQLLYELDEQLNKWIEEPLANEEKKLKANAFTFFVKKAVMANMAKFNKARHRKMNYQLNRLGLTHVDWSRAKGFAIAKLLYWLARFTAPERTNLNAIRECLANDLYRVFLPNHTQELFLLSSIHKNGQLKFFLDGKHAQGSEILSFGKEDKKFAGLQLHGREAYSSLTPYLKEGYFTQAGPDHKPLFNEQGHYQASHFNLMGLYGPLFNLMADRDALGSKGDNKLLDLRTNSLFIIDPGKSLPKGKLMGFMNLKDNFSFTQPRDVMSYFSGGYKNFTLFDDACITEKMTMIHLLAQLQGTNDAASYSEIADTYFQPLKGAIIKLPLKKLDEKVFDDYIEHFQEWHTHTKRFIAVIGGNSKFLPSQNGIVESQEEALKELKKLSENQPLLYEMLIAACANATSRPKAAKKLTPEEWFAKCKAAVDHQVDSARYPAVESGFKWSKKSLRILQRHLQFYQQAGKEIAATKIAYIRRRDAMIGLFTKPHNARLYLKHDELLLLDNIEKLVSKTSPLSKPTSFWSRKRVQLNHLRVIKRVSLAMQLDRKNGKGQITFPNHKYFQIFEKFIDSKQLIGVSCDPKKHTVNFQLAEISTLLPQFFSETAIAAFKKQPLCNAPKMAALKLQENPLNEPISRPVIFLKYQLEELSMEKEIPQKEAAKINFKNNKL